MQHIGRHCEHDAVLSAKGATKEQCEGLQPSMLGVSNKITLQLLGNCVATYQAVTSDKLFPGRDAQHSTA